MHKKRTETLLQMLLARVIITVLLPRMLFAFTPALILTLCFFACPYLCINAQTTDKVRTISSDFINESGSPIAVTLAKTELDLDPFDAPLDARIYISYKNVSDKPIDAVKFRIRFGDAADGDRGTFHAPDQFTLMPGAERTQKWRRESIHPLTTSLKIRILQVKFADGTIWQSSKMQELSAP